VEARNVGERAEHDVTLAHQFVWKMSVESFVVRVHHWAEVVYILALWLPKVLQRIPVTSTSQQCDNYNLK